MGEVECVCHGLIITDEGAEYSKILWELYFQMFYEYKVGVVWVSLRDLISYLF